MARSAGFLTDLGDIIESFAKHGCLAAANGNGLF